MTTPPCQFSVVVPVYNESQNILPLVAEIGAALADYSHQIIFVDDGSTDDTTEICRQASGVLLLTHQQNKGQSAAVLTGVENSQAPWIITLDGDGQNDPSEIPKLIAQLEKYDVAIGVRCQRHDTLWRRFGSRLAFRIRNMILKDGIIDIGCGLRIFPKHAAQALPAFDGLHRLMPALFVVAGLKIAQIPTQHRARHSGESKYGNLQRGRRGLLDLAGLYWLKRRMLPLAAKKPNVPNPDTIKIRNMSEKEDE